MNDTMPRMGIGPMLEKVKRSATKLMSGPREESFAIRKNKGM